MSTELKDLLLEFEKAIDVVLARDSEDDQGGDESAATAILEAAKEAKEVLRVVSFQCDRAVDFFCEWIDGKAAKQELPGSLRTTLEVAYAADACESHNAQEAEEKVGAAEREVSGEQVEESVCCLEAGVTAKREDTQSKGPLGMELSLRALGTAIYVHGFQRGGLLEASCSDAPKGPAEHAGVGPGWRLSHVHSESGRCWPDPSFGEDLVSALLGLFLNDTSDAADDLESPLGGGSAAIEHVERILGPLTASFVHLDIPALVTDGIASLLRPESVPEWGAWPPPLAAAPEALGSSMVTGNWRDVKKHCAEMGKNLRPVRLFQTLPQLCAQLHRAILQQPHWLPIAKEVVHLIMTRPSNLDATSIRAWACEFRLRLLGYLRDAYPERVSVSLRSNEDIEVAKKLLDYHNDNLDPVTLRLRGCHMLAGCVLDKSHRLLLEGPLLGASEHVPLGDRLMRCNGSSHHRTLIFGKDREDFEIVDRLGEKIVSVLERPSILNATGRFARMIASAAEWLLQLCSAAWDYFRGPELLLRFIQLPEVAEFLSCEAFKRLWVATPGLSGLLAELGVTPSTPAFAMLLSLTFAAPAAVQPARYTGPLLGLDPSSSALPMTSRVRALVMTLFPFHGQLFVGVDCVLRVSMADRALHFALERDECWVRADRALAKPPLSLDLHTLLQGAGSALGVDTSGSDSPVKRVSGKLIRSLSGSVDCDTSLDDIGPEPLAMRAHVRRRVVLTTQMRLVTDAAEITRSVEQRHERELQAARQSKWEAQQLEQRRAREEDQRMCQSMRFTLCAICVIFLASLAHPTGRSWIGRGAASTLRLLPTVLKFAFQLFVVVLICALFCCCAFCAYCFRRR